MNLALRKGRSKTIKAIVAAIFIASLLFLIPQTAFAYPVTGNAVKTEEATIGAGVTPDSFLYFLDKALDNINLALTFDSAEKSRKGLNIARERLMEVRTMAAANKFEAAKLAQQEHAQVLSVVQSSVGRLDRANSTHELEEEIEIENELEEHEKEVEDVQAELKIKLEIKGEITPQQQDLIDSVLTLMQNKTGEVKIKIENKKGETKLNIKAETGKSEVEIEEEVEELEEKAGLTALRQEKAEEQIEDALEELTEVKAELLEVNITEFNITAVTGLIMQAEQKIAQAQEAFNESKFGEAFGLANAAEQLAENAEKILERVLEVEEEEKEEKKEEKEEREIEVEIEEDIAKVKIEIGGNKLKYRTPFATEAELLSDIASRTGLSLEEVKALAKIEVEEELGEEEEVEEKIDEELEEVATNRSGRIRKIVIEDLGMEDRKARIERERWLGGDIKAKEEKGKIEEEQEEAEERKLGRSSKSDSGSSDNGDKSGSNGEGRSGSGSGSGGEGSSSDSSGKGSGSDGED